MTLRPARLALACLSAGILSASACDSPVEACNAIGCESGVTVRLNSLPVGAFTVEILPQSPSLYPAIYRYDCVPGEGYCSADILFPDFLPTKLQVRVTTSLGVATYQFNELTYYKYSMRDQCGPACRHTSVTVAIPE